MVTTADGSNADPAARATGTSPLIVATRVRPNARRTAVGGCHDGPYGPAVVVAVQAPPVDGQATEAARRALAVALGVRPARVTLRAGATSRDKLFAVADPAPELADRVGELRGQPR